MSLQSPAESLSPLPFTTNSPIFIGLCGPAGSGKTSTADKLVPRAQLTDLSKYPDTLWNHYWFSSPLYEMANIKLMTEGDDRDNRILYGLHEIVSELMKRRIPFDDFVELIYDIHAMPCEDDGKPRSFLQNTGDLCRNRYADCFADYVKYRVHAEYRNVVSEYDHADQERPWVVAVVSDVRLPNEAQMIKSQPNNMLIKLTASPEKLSERLYNRDGTFLTREQAEHNSENSFDLIPSTDFDAIIDTTNKTLDEVANEVKMVIASGPNKY